MYQHHSRRSPGALSSCPCELEAASAARGLEFRRADEFANRTSFLPCSAASEQACVAPDGTVHPIDYFQPPLGRLAEESFLALWQGETMQRLRAAALCRINPALRAVCPR